MKNIIKFFAFAAIMTLCLNACERNVPYSNYVVEGRVIDKITKEPIEGILVSFNIYDLPSPNSQIVITRLSPPEYDGWSDENGNFRAFYTQPRSSVYFYDYNGLYKDTAIFIDFKDVPLSDRPYRNYKGSYVLNMGDVELEKIN